MASRPDATPISGGAFGVTPKKPRTYQMGRCKKCRRRYRLPLSADPKLPALAQCDRCFAAEVRAMSEELRRLTEKST